MITLSSILAGIETVQVRPRLPPLLQLTVPIATTIGPANERVLKDEDREMSGSSLSRKMALSPGSGSFSNREIVWNEMYNRLKEFQRKNHTCSVPRRHDKSLSVWVDSQRNAYRQGAMSDHRIQKLEEINFVWRTREKDVQDFERMFVRLCRYKEEHGDCNVPKNYIEDRALAGWVHRIRMSGLSRKDWVARLTDIGFILPPREDKCPGSWDKMYQALRKFHQVHGHCNVPIKSDFCRGLGVWVKRQRNHGNTKKLSDERRVKLDLLDFTWDLTAVQMEQLWFQNFEKLKTYKAKYGHMKVPRSFQDDPQLGGWVSRNRFAGRMGNLSIERMLKLDSIGFWDNAFTPTDKGKVVLAKFLWISRFKRLKAFYKDFGHCAVSRRHDPELAYWVEHQRVRAASRLLSSQEELLLETLNFFCKSPSDENLVAANLLLTKQMVHAQAARVSPVFSHALR